jgi:predicted dehydrogenase
VGSHAIDLARYLVGEIERVVATTEIWVRERPVPTSSLAFEPVRAEAEMAAVDLDDSAYFLGRFTGGAIGVFEISRCAAGRKNQLALEIHGSLGSVCYDYERPNEVQLYLNDHDSETAGFRTILIGPAQDNAALLAFAGVGWDSPRASSSRCGTCWRRSRAVRPCPRVSTMAGAPSWS